MLAVSRFIAWYFPPEPKRTHMAYFLRQTVGQLGPELNFYSCISKSQRIFPTWAFFHEFGSPRFYSSFARMSPMTPPKEGMH